MSGATTTEPPAPPTAQPLPAAPPQPRLLAAVAEQGGRGRRAEQTD